MKKNTKNNNHQIQLEMVTTFKKLSRQDKSIIGNTLYHKPFKSKKIYNRQQFKQFKIENI